MPFAPGTPRRAVLSQTLFDKLSISDAQQPDVHRIEEPTTGALDRSFQLELSTAVKAIESRSWQNTLLDQSAVPGSRAPGFHPHPQYSPVSAARRVACRNTRPIRRRRRWPKRRRKAAGCPPQRRDGTDGRSWGKEVLFSSLNCCFFQYIYCWGGFIWFHDPVMQVTAGEKS